MSEKVGDDGLGLHGGISSVPGKRYDITRVAREGRDAGFRHDWGAMKDLQWVCFDLDGVVVDSELLLFEAERLGFANYGVTYCSPHWEALLTEQPVATDFVSTGLTLKLGCLDLVKRLTEHDIPCALVTSAPRAYADRALDRFGLRHLFAIVVTQEDISKPKPAPDLYLAVAKAAAISPELCLAFEDSPRGIASAKAAGLYCVAVTGSGFGDAALYQANEVIDSLDEFDEKSIGRLLYPFPLKLR